MWKCGPEYSNQTIAVHRVKKIDQQRIAYSGIRPFITAMAKDCDGSWQGQKLQSNVLGTIREFATGLLTFRFSQSTNNRSSYIRKTDENLPAGSSLSDSTMNYTQVPTEQCLKWTDVRFQH
jgi:hypothetical protein